MDKKNEKEGYQIIKIFLVIDTQIVITERVAIAIKI